MVDTPRTYNYLMNSSTGILKNNTTGDISPQDLRDAFETMFRRTPVSVSEYGAVGDGVANDTAEIQAAIDAVATAGGGAVIFPPGTYKVDPIMLRSGVHLVGGSGQMWNHTYSDFSASLEAVSSTQAAVIFSETDNGTPSGNNVTTDGASISGLTIRGSASGTGVSRGVWMKHALYCSIRNCLIIQCDGPGIQWDAGNPNWIQDVHTYSCVWNRDITDPVGTIHLGAQTADFYIRGVEANASTWTDYPITGRANPYCCAGYIDGGNHTIDHCIFELSDVGLYVEAHACKITGVRADINWTHGMMISGYENIFTGCQVYRASLATNNGYDGFNCWGPRNIFTGCMVHTDWINDTNIVRYGFNDAVYGGEGGTDTYQYNHWNGCWADAGQTSKYQSGVHGHWIMPDAGITIVTDNSTTPDVGGISALRFQYTLTRTITNFLGGVGGQPLDIQMGSGTSAITIANNANIVTNTGANKALVANRFYKFRHYNGVWYEYV